MISLNAKAKPNPEVVCTKLQNGETVLLHLGSQTYYSLNETGSQIWIMLDQGFTFDEISHRLLEKFDVSEEHAQKSVLDLVGDLSSEKLIAVTNV